MFECKKCEALEKQVAYLQGLVERLMLKIDVAPIYDQEDDDEEKGQDPEDDREIIMYGEG